MTVNNKKLGQFDLIGIEMKPRGGPTIDVTFQIDNSNMLSATALDRGTGKSVSVTLTRDNGDIDDGSSPLINKRSSE